MMKKKHGDDFNALFMATTTALGKNAFNRVEKNGP